jgi:putative ABC transport system permease protein
MTTPSRLYRVLLKLYPVRFREEFGAPLERQFADEYREARGRQARLAFWGRTMLDLLRSVPVELLRELGRDARYAVRMHARRPLVAVLAVTALALAIGATTGVFSVVHALLLRSLPFQAPDRIVHLFPSPGMKSPAEFHEWRTHRPYLEDVVTFDSAEMTFSRTSDAQRVKVTETSSNFFAMIGSQPAIGRGFSRGEDTPGRDTVAVISDALWQQAFGGDRAAVGSTIRLNGVPATIVGIARRGFDYPARTAVWTPSTFDFERYPKTDVTFWESVGRLKPGLALAQAGGLFAAEMERMYPGALERDERNRPRLIPLRDQLAGAVRKASLVLLGVVAFVLLVACANVANLLLTRNAQRHTELLIKATLGASRARLVQQLVTESLLLALVSGVAGLAVAHWVSRLAASAQPVQLALQEYTILDWRVLGFALALAVLTGILFGVLPACLVGRLQPSHDLVRAHGRSTGTGAAWLRQGLVAVQIALALVLVSGAVVMGRSFLALLGTDLGFQTARVATLSVSLAGTRHDTPDLRRQYMRDALIRLRAVPGVEAAAAVDSLPLATNAFSGGHFIIDSGRKVPLAAAVTVTTDFFRAMGTGVLHGREFTAADRQGGDPVAIVNEAFARKAGETATLVGRKMTVVGGKRTLTIIGVVRTVRYSGPGHDGGPQVYLPYEQRSPGQMTFAVRVSASPESLLPASVTAVRSVDRQVAVFGAKTLSDHLAETLARPRFYVTAILFFGGLALLLAIIGVYGVASYATTQRTHEIGVRIAVGASAGGVRRLLLGQNLVPVGVGAVAGVAGALAMGRFLSHLLASARAVDAATCAIVAGLLVLTAATAVWRATSRVVRLNPIEVLRAE